jgi:1,4-alpha-glucan branching enzyme
VYAAEFGAHEAFDLDADGPPMDGCAQSGLVAAGPYSVIVLSRED